MKRKNKGGVVTEFIKTILYALMLAGIIRTLLFQPFWIPSGSMKPTLLVGDFIFVNKYAYGYSKYSCPFSICPISNRIFGRPPERGDVVVFRHPVNGKDFVKRLIGLPGDLISLKSGELFINNKKVKYKALKEFVEIKSRQGPLASIPRCENSPVPLGSNCRKSHYLEELPNGISYSILIGRVDKIIFSSAGKSMLFFWTWRIDRFFRSVL